MNCRLRSLVLFFIISAWLSMAIMAAAASSDKSDKPAKDDSAVGAAATADKPAKEEPAAKPAKEEPAPAAAKPAKEEPDPAAAKPAKEEPAAAPAPPAAPTYTVKREPFKIQFELDGFFESRDMTEIIFHPEEWTSFIIVQAAEHGARVKKGDVLLEFDSEKIDKAIADLRTERQITEVALKQAEDQLSVLEKSTPLDLESSQRAQRLAEEDQKNYSETARPMEIKTMDKMVTIYSQQLEYARQELEQLEKMYKADDLTEETEKIVLQRARNTVDRVAFYLEREEYERDQIMKYQLPRMDEQIKEAVQRKTLAWNKDKVELPLTLEKLRLEVPKQKVQLARSKERLKNLLADQELMKIKAPADGYVYYGRCQRGKFNEIASLTETLRRGGNAMPHHALMTIVEPRPLFIHSTISEDRLQYIRNGMDGKAWPTGYPDIKLDVTVDEVGKVPFSLGSFDLQLSLDLEDQLSKVILPGMSCKIKLMPYSKSEALIVPPKLVSTDTLDDEKHFVYLQTKDGKSEKRDVTIGKQNDKQMEILKGLSEGDKILLEPPKDAK
jgi:multidrug efflux pump subunit AcrA (membrane-fusion protein)